MKNILIPFAVGTLTVLAPAALFAQAKLTYQLHSGRKPGQTDCVVAELTVGGEVTEVVDGKTHPEKMSVVCKLRYDEKTLEVPTGSTGRWRSVRYYNTVEAVVKVGEGGQKPTLPPRRRLIGVENDARTVTLFSPRGPLTREELEVIDVQGNSLLLDQLLPKKPVGVGDAWKHSEELTAALFGLEEVAETNLQSVLSKVTDTSAQIEMSGRIEGAVYGVATKIEVKAKYRFNRKSNRIDWFGLLLQENRKSSYVTDGVEAVAKVQVQISPTAGSAELSDEALKDLPLESNAELQQLDYEPPAAEYRFAYDRCWHVYRDRAALTVLRMMDRGELVAQCNVAVLPELAPGKQVSLDSFQNDVRRALDKSFGEFVQAGQWANEADYRVYRVVVRGEVSELPIEWNYYLVADEHGHRVVFAFTVESNLVERLNKADQKLVSSLRFLDPEVAGEGGE